METSYKSCTVPIAFILAPRVETVTRVLAAIKAARPAVLYVISDEGWTPETKAKFTAVKNLIAQVDWCEVHTNYAEENMGAKARLASGISWSSSMKSVPSFSSTIVCHTHHSFRFAKNSLSDIRMMNASCILVATISSR